VITTKEFPKLERITTRGEVDLFKSVIVGPWTVSIQASSTSYSTPRRTFQDPDCYVEFEVAIWPTETPNDWCRPREYPKLARFAELFESGKNPVAGYVTRSVIVDLLGVLEGVDPRNDRKSLDDVKS
jgi:hypothetical protein